MAGAPQTSPYLVLTPAPLAGWNRGQVGELSAVAPKYPALPVSEGHRERRTLGEHRGSHSLLVLFVWEEGVSTGWQGKHL